MSLTHKTAKPYRFVELENGCMVCVSHAPNKDGYVQFYQKKNGKKQGKLLHRVLCEHFVGELTSDYHVHHRCETKLCCNPVHLEAITDAEHCRITNQSRYRKKLSDP